MSKFNRVTTGRIPADEGAIMAELDGPGDEPNFDLFGSFGLEFLRDDELLLTEIDLTEQKETIEQTEIGQLNDEDLDSFITENWNRIEANCNFFFFSFVVE